jgi:Domain of unknown function (DUF1707)
MPAPQPGSQPGGPRSLFGDADRERLVALLREHYAHGGLSLDELDRRVGMVLSAEFADEAAPAVADLPPLAAPRQAGKPARGRGRRHAQASGPATGWLPTSERFRDPASGKIMRVWIDPADQSRHYVPEDAS